MRYGVFRFGALLRDFGTQEEAVSWLFHGANESPAFLTTKPITGDVNGGLVTVPVCCVCDEAVPDGAGGDIPGQGCACQDCFSEWREAQT